MIFPKCLKCRRLPVGAKSIRFPKRSTQMSIIKTCYIRACNRKCSYASLKCPNITLLENNYMHRTIAHSVHAKILTAQIICGQIPTANLTHRTLKVLLFYFNLCGFIIMFDGFFFFAPITCPFSAISQSLWNKKDVNSLFAY